MVGAVVAARPQPGHRDQLADHLGGGRFVLDDVTRRDRRRRRASVGKPLGPRPESLRHALDDDEDEILRAVQGDRLEDDRRAHRPHIGELAVQTEDAELGEIDTDRTGGDPVAPGHRDRRRLPQVFLAAGLGFHRDLRRHRADAQAGAQELVVASLPSPQIEGAQRRPAGEVGEVGRLMDPFGALVEQCLLDLGLALLQPATELVDRVGELPRTALAAVPPLTGHRQRRQQRHDEEHRRTEQGEHRQPGDQREDRRDHREAPRLRLGGDVAERLEGPLLNDDRLVRRAPERNLTELIPLAVGAAAEDAQRYGSRPELDDVVGPHDGRLGDWVAVDDDRIRRRRVRDDACDQVVVDDDRQLVIRDGHVVEAHAEAAPPADLVAPRQEHERPPRLRSGRHVATHRFRQRLAIERVDAVQLEPERVTRDDAALDDRQVEGDLLARPLEKHRLTGIPVAVTEFAGGAEEVADAVVGLDLEAQIRSRNVAPAHPDQQLHPPIPTASAAGNDCAGGSGNRRKCGHVVPTDDSQQAPAVDTPLRTGASLSTAANHRRQTC